MRALHSRALMDTSSGAAFPQRRSCWRKVPKVLGLSRPLCAMQELCFRRSGNSLPPGLAPASHQGCLAQLVARRAYGKSLGKGSKLVGPTLAPFCQQPGRSYLALRWPPSARAGGINFSTFCAKPPPPPSQPPRLPLTGSGRRRPPRRGLGTRMLPPGPSLAAPSRSRKRVTVMQKNKARPAGSPPSPQPPRRREAPGAGLQLPACPAAGLRPRTRAAGRPRHGLASGPPPGGPAAAAGPGGGAAGDRLLHRP